MYRKSNDAVLVIGGKLITKIRRLDSRPRRYGNEIISKLAELRLAGSQSDRKLSHDLLGERLGGRPERPKDQGSPRKVGLSCSSDSYSLSVSRCIPHENTGNRSGSVRAHCAFDWLGKIPRARPLTGKMDVTDNEWSRNQPQINYKMVGAVVRGSKRKSFQTPEPSRQTDQERLPGNAGSGRLVSPQRPSARLYQRVQAPSDQA